ncbi:hypothetical protein Rhopal_004408-T1 [Rhodotorula paludigena]|uniref:Diphthamide biosynthesis protein 4 n=1 Tax=Rhodotorula paludigena TaxID=86838 RepID=A0AAV5GQU2_9BASI|nr:hypothetical protein Rhopal_004408-T1 [Rhodotorula paludigena]
MWITLRNTRRRDPNVAESETKAKEEVRAKEAEQRARRGASETTTSNARAVKLDGHGASGHTSTCQLARVDLYARLGLSPSSSQAEIRQAYRALILLAEVAARGQASAEELNEAWEVLSHEDKRRDYDAARAAHLAASRASSNAFAVSLSLDLFEPHYATLEDQEGSEGGEDEDEPAYYTHPCRCSSQFRISREQLENGVEVVTCEGCSERCRVEYDVVEE